MKTWIILAAAAAAGCAGAAAPARYPKAALTNAPEWDRLMDLEREGRFGPAAERYGEIAGDETLSWNARTRALIRLGRCREAESKPEEALRMFRSVIEREDILADEFTSPYPGSLDLNLRRQAEAGIRRAGGEPVFIYHEIVSSGTPGQKLAAIESLGRLKNPSSIKILSAVARDDSLPRTLRDAASAARDRVASARRGD